MGTTADKLNKLMQTKTAIKTAIEAKGQTIGDIPFSQYPAKIDAITSGGGGTIEDYLNSVGRGDLINDLLYVITRSVEMQDNSKTLYYLVTDNTNGGILFVDGCLPSGNNMTINYQKPIISIRNVDFSKWVFTSSGGRAFAYNGNLVEFSGVSTEASGEGITDFSECIIAARMFEGCASLREVKLYLPKVENLESMFSDCIKLTKVTIKGVVNKINASYMFNNCPELVEVNFIGDALLTNQVRGMFNKCSKLTVVNGIIDITGLNNIGSFLDPLGATMIEEIRVKGLSESIAIASPNISKESLLYLFNNAETVSSKQILLNANVYNSLTPEEINIAANKGFSVRAQ